MSDPDREWTPSEEYMLGLFTAALTKCDEEQAPKLVAQHIALYPRIDQVIDRTVELHKSGQDQQAVVLLDEMIDRVERCTRPYPAAAVQDVFAYPMTRLYLQRGLMRFGAASSAADQRAALADMDRARSYPTSMFAELDPELLTALGMSRALVQTTLETNKAGESSKSGKCFIATAAYGSALAPEVMTLRSFREANLRPHAAGRWFIRCYERYSPPLAAAIAERPAARLWVRRLLLRPLLALVGRQASCLEDKQ